MYQLFKVWYYQAGDHLSASSIQNATLRLGENLLSRARAWHHAP